MTVTGTDEPALDPPGPAAALGSPTVDRRRSLEAWAWLFMRLSGLALLFLAVFHFAITHVLNDVVDTDYAFVSRRWDKVAWRIFDWLLLTLALLHGLVGLRWIIDDYVRQPRVRAATKAGLYGVSGALFALGTVTIVTF